MHIRKLKEKLGLLAIVMLIGAIIFFVGISYIKFHNDSSLIITLLGFSIMSASGFKIDELKKKAGLTNYRKFQSFMRK